MQHQSELHYYCFNSNCPLPDQRLFALQDSISQVHESKCYKWLISHQTIKELSSIKPCSQNKSIEQCLMFSAPIETILYYHQYEQSIRQNIASTFNTYRLQVNQMITYCQASFHQQFQCLKKNINLFKNVIISSGQFSPQPTSELLKIHKEYISKKIQISINSPCFNTLCKDLQVFSTLQINKHCFEIKDNINKFFRQHFFNELAVDAELEKVQFNDMIQVEKYLQQVSSVQNSQKIYNLLSWNEGQYINEHETTGFKMKCPLCLFSTQQKQTIKKSGCIKLMIDHLCFDHLPYLAMCFSYRMSKTAVYDIGLQEIIYLMKKYNYDQIDLIDANNTKPIYYEPRPKCLTILFTNDTIKSHLYEHKYFKYSTPQEAAFAIILLIEYICIKEPKKMRIINFKRNYFNLFQGIITSCKLQNVRIQEKYFQGIRFLKQMGKIKVILQES